MSEEIGTRIRKMREAQDLSIEQVSRITGIPAERLQAFEEGDAVPSIGLVIKVSRVLGARVGHLLHERGNRPEVFSVRKWGDFQVVERSGGPPRTSDQGYTYQSMLPPDMVGQSMEPFLLTFDPEKGEGVEPIAHEGEEFLHVLEGAVELTYGDEVYTLEKGDVVYLDSSRAHCFRGLPPGKPKVMVILSSRD